MHYIKSFAHYASISNPKKSCKLLFKLYALNKTYFIRRGLAQAGSVIVKGGSRECVGGWGGAACGMRTGSYKRIIFIGLVQMLECWKIHLLFV